MADEPAPASDLFVGRDAELTELRAALRSAAAGSGGVRLLAGEPGIGKTRLAREIAAEAEADGFAVGWGRTWEAGGAPPFWPWTRALRDLLRSYPEDEVRHALRRVPAGTALLPELAQELGQPVFEAAAGGASTQERFAVFEAVSTLLAELGRTRPALLVFEDVHAADEPSLLLLQFVTTDVRAAPVLVLATFRDVEARQEQRRAARVGELARQAVTLNLTGLSAQHTGSLLSARLPAPDDALVEQLQEATSGNPFFIEELLRLRRSGATGTDRIPLGVRETVRSRLALVPQQTYDVVVTAAVYGRSFDEQVLALILDLAPEQVTDLLRPALDAALVLREGDELRFRHGLIREVLVDETAAAERARIHARVVDVLEALPPLARERHLSELAHHAVRAVSGNAEQAIVHARNAGDAAMRALAFEEAVRHYEDALQVSAVTAATDSVALDLLVALVSARGGAGDLAGAREAAREVRSRSTPALSPQHLAQAALGYPSMTMAVWRTDEEHLALLRGALNALGPEGDPATRAKLLCTLVSESYFTPAPVTELMAEAVQLAEASGDPAAIAQSCFTSHYDTRKPQITAAALEHDRSVQLAQRAGDPRLESQVRLWRIGRWLELGHLSCAEAERVEYEQLVERTRRPIDLWWIKVMRAMRLAREGRYAEAQPAVQEAVDYGYRFAGEQALSVFGAQDYLVRADRTPWEEILAGLLALPDDFRQRLPVRCALVRIRAAMGQNERARAELADLAIDDYGLLPDRSRLTGFAMLAHAAADVQDEVRAAELLAQTERYAGRLAVALAPFADFGPIDLHRGRLLHLLGRFDQAAAAFEAALRMCERTDARPDAVRTRLHHGTLLADTGETERARGVLTRARDDAVAMGMTLVVDAAEARLAALGAPTPSVPPPAPVVGVVQIRREGEYWSVGLGDTTLRLRDSKGLQYLSRLICNPGKQIHVLELASAGGVPARPTGREDLRVAVDDLGPVLDERAKAEYRRRISDLDREIEEAAELHDDERAARAREERDAFMMELSRALGLHGRDRRTGSVAEQTRINVSKAVRTAIRRLQEQDAELGGELDASVRTGLLCAYLPLAGQRRWQVTAGT